MNTFKKILIMTFYLSYFHFCALNFAIKNSCRDELRNSLLSFRYILEQPYIKFIQTGETLELYKKILCPINNIIQLNYIFIGRVNQQVTSLLNFSLEKFNNNGTSETACEITFQFEEYFKIRSKYKCNINQSFLE